MSTTQKFISLYTPSRTDPELLEAIFVQRERLADMSLDRLRASSQSPGADKYHLLFVGPRGSGKTHLVTLLVHRLMKDAALADRLRIAWLPEDESTPAFFKFLLRICRALQSRYPREFPDPPMADLHALPDDNGRSERLVRFILERLNGRTLLVVVENLDEVFEGLGTKGQQQWRAFLQEHPVAATLATSQQLTEEMSGRDEPFFGFFQTEYLKPLSLNDATELLRKIAATNDKEDLKEFLGTSTGRSRVRAIRHLSGGSHRIYIALSEFLTRESLDDLVSAFNQLLDELTPYYQERLRWLPNQQREIVEYLCKCRQTTPVKDIARDLFIAETTASAQLKQLRDRGYVISNTVGREARYELAEPLMRLCVEVKENRREPIRLIVEFLRVWYDKDRCENWLVHLPPEADTERKYLEAVLRELGDGEKSPHAELLLKEFAALSSEDRLEQLEGFSHDLNAANPTRVQQLEYAQILLNDELVEETLLVIERVLTLGPESFHGHMARAHLLISLDKRVDAEVALARATALGGDDAKGWLVRGGNAAELGRHQDAVKWFDRAIALEPKMVEAWKGKILNLILLGRTHDSINANTQAISVSPDDPALWFFRAALLLLIRHTMEASDAIEKALAIGETDAALGLKGIILYTRGQLTDAAELLTRAIAKLPNDSVLLSARGAVYAEIGNNEASLADLVSAAKETPDGLVIESLAAVTGRSNRWEQAFKLLRKRLREYSINTASHQQLFTGVSFVNSILISTTVQTMWKERLDKLIAVHKKAKSLTYLGIELLQSLWRFPRELLTGELLTGWIELWREFAKVHAELEMPVRLYEVGIRYLQTQDERVFLDLLQEERKILRDALELPSTDTE